MPGTSFRVRRVVKVTRGFEVARQQGELMAMAYEQATPWRRGRKPAGAERDGQGRREGSESRRAAG